MYRLLSAIIIFVYSISVMSIDSGLASRQNAWRISYSHVHVESAHLDQDHVKSLDREVSFFPQALVLAQNPSDRNESNKSHSHHEPHSHEIQVSSNMLSAVNPGQLATSLTQAAPPKALVSPVDEAPPSDLFLGSIFRPPIA